MSVVIQVDNLGKKYKIGRNGAGTDGLRHAIHDFFAAPFRRLGRPTPDTRHLTPDLTSDLRPLTSDSEDFWALKDVSFEVNQGEVVGIIGRNGAGKSTLLKILSRITEPTTGRLRIRGRVASLLEVGTGFHPELTGRENVFLNGAILGMSRAEIKRKFDEIVAFAEVEQFLDTPVKRYSSGMYVRLAFAVAAHLEPEILIVDEVLAVGDAQFQKKCLGKMGEVSREGRTVLFVSHNMQAISTLTQRCFLLRNGLCIKDGVTSRVITAYLQDGLVEGATYLSPPSPHQPSVTRVQLQTSEPNNSHVSGKPMRLIFDVDTPVGVPSAAFSFQILDSLMQPVVHLWVLDSEPPLCRTPGTYRLTCDIPKLRLYLGRYFITTHLAEGEGGLHFQTIEGICPFEVVMYGKNREWRWQEGSCRYLEEGSWTVSVVNQPLALETSLS